MNFEMQKERPKIVFENIDRIDPDTFESCIINYFLINLVRFYTILWIFDQTSNKMRKFTIY